MASSSRTAPDTTSGNTLHGNGAHLDNLETHDERLLLPNTCFSVEPGVYLKKFGIPQRAEHDCHSGTGCRDRAGAAGAW